MKGREGKGREGQERGWDGRSEKRKEGRMTRDEIVGKRAGQGRVGDGRGDEDGAGRG